MQICPYAPACVPQAHGDLFDFKGVDGGIYVLLSTSRLSLAVQFEHSRFRTPYSKLWVQGSWIRRAFWTITTSSGRLTHTEIDARRPSLNGSTKARVSVVEDIQYAFEGNRGHGKVARLSIITPTWRTWADVTKGSPHWGQLRIDVYMQPLYDVASDKVAPHGLIGQTYDRDGLPQHGRRDRYDVLDDGTPTRARHGVGGTVTTRAKGEGAIEGEASMYLVKRPFDTSFAFSRFSSNLFRLPFALRNVTTVHRG